MSLQPTCPEENRARPGLNQALAAVRAGDTLVVPKLDRPARSVPDARAIGDYTITDLADLFKVSRPTVYHTLAEPNSPTTPM